MKQPQVMWIRVQCPGETEVDMGSHSEEGPQGTCLPLASLPPPCLPQFQQCLIIVPATPPNTQPRGWTGDLDLCSIPQLPVTLARFPVAKAIKTPMNPGVHKTLAAEEILLRFHSLHIWTFGVVPS